MWTKTEPYFRGVSQFLPRFPLLKASSFPRRFFIIFSFLQVHLCQAEKWPLDSSGTTSTTAASSTSSTTSSSSPPATSGDTTLVVVRSLWKGINERKRWKKELKFKFNIYLEKVCENERLKFFFDKNLWNKNFSLFGHFKRIFWIFLPNKKCEMRLFHFCECFSLFSRPFLRVNRDFCGSLPSYPKKWKAWRGIF